MLAQVFERLGGVVDQDGELVDFARHIRARHVLAGHAHAVDVGQRVGDAGDGREIIAGALAPLPAGQIEDLDARHARHEPGVRGVEVDGVAPIAIPEPYALGHGRECGAHHRGIEAHHPVGAHIAAGRLEQIDRLGARFECTACVPQQLQGRIDQQLHVAFRQ